MVGARGLTFRSGDDPTASALFAASTALRDELLRGVPADGGSLVTQLCDLLMIMNEPADAIDLADRSLGALPGDHPDRLAITERRTRAHAMLGGGDGD